MAEMPYDKIFGGSLTNEKPTFSRRSFGHSLLLRSTLSYMNRSCQSLQQQHCGAQTALSLDCVQIRLGLVEPWGGVFVTARTPSQDAYKLQPVAGNCKRSMISMRNIPILWGNMAAAIRHKSLRCNSLLLTTSGTAISEAAQFSNYPIIL